MRSDHPARPVPVRSRHRWLRTLIVFAAAGSLAGTVAPSAQAVALNVRGDSDSIQATVTSVASNYPHPGNESVDSLKDRNPATKWYTGNQPTTAVPIYAIYTLSSPGEATAYSLTSGNDSPERDPKEWTILGSNDAAAATDATHASWATVDSRTNQTFASRGQRSVYAATSPASYQYYQLRVTANLANSSTSGNNTQFQIADWTLRTGVAGASSSIVTPTTQWSYLEDGTIDPANGAADRTAWTQVGATLPGTWKTAAGPFGAKNGSATPVIGANFPITTVLKYYLSGTTTPTVPAYFFRYTFELDQAGFDSIKGLYGTFVHDDAATVYLNGTAIADFPGATAPTSNLGYGGNNNGDPAIEQLLIPSTALRVGDNVLSVELHNVNATSSDVYFSMPTLAATSDTVPAPFTPAEIGATYTSSTVPSDFFTNLLTGFNDVKSNTAIVGPNSTGPNNAGGATLTAANDRVDIAINNGGSGSEQVKVDKRSQAIYDADNSSYIAMTDALGSVLGPLYRSALQTGELPKTKWLLDNVENSSYEAANNSAKAAYGYQRPMNRLGFTTGGTCSGGSFTGTTGWIIPNYGSTSGYNGLCTQGSFPSGHTLHGYIAGTTMATILPELAPQFLYRSSEYGNNRLLLGFHYPLDVMAGRMIGQASIANRWSDSSFRALLTQATEEARTVLGAECVELGYSADLVACAEEGSGVISDSDALQTYTDRLTYAAYTTTDGVRHTDGFPVVDSTVQNTPVIVPEGAANLLRSSFPDLTDAQRTSLLQATALPGGYALDKTASSSASWQRINLVAAMTSVDLGTLAVNGQSALDGVRDASSYDIALPAGTTTAQVTATALNSTATVSITQPASLPGVATVTVTSPGSVTSRSYTVNVSVLASSDATLSSLTVGGAPVAGFSPATTTYNVQLPAGTTTVPNVSAVATESHASIVYTTATTLPGTTLVTVTAQDGTTLQSYSVNFTVAPAPGGNKVNATVKAVTAATTYNTPAKVTATVTAPGATVLGTIRVAEGSTLLGAGVLSGGRATVTLSKALTAGTHHLTVTYVSGSATVVAPAPTRLSLTVKKANGKLAKVSITKGKKGKNKVAKGKKATLKIQLKGVGAAAPTGSVTVKVGSKSYGKAKVKKSGTKYIAVVKTKALKKTGKVKVVYSGSTNLAKKTFSTKVRVR